MDEQDLIAVFRLAGIPIVTKYEIENRYWPKHPKYEDVRKPWWIVNTEEFGLLCIGWRKRVIEFDWEATEFRGKITADDVTQGETYVHAWGYGKMILYLQSFRNQFRMQRRDRREATEALAGPIPPATPPPAPTPQPDTPQGSGL